MTLKNTAVKLDAEVGAIVHPTRLALTGSNVGPSLYHLLEVLGNRKYWHASIARFPFSNSPSSRSYPRDRA
jgi:hypothetical protein